MRSPATTPGPVRRALLIVLACGLLGACDGGDGPRGGDAPRGEQAPDADAGAVDRSGP
jgi:hypothetical protein